MIIERRETEVFQVECWSLILNEWSPSSMAQLTAEKAHELKARWKKVQPDRKFRVVRRYSLYVVEEVNE